MLSSSWDIFVWKYGYFLFVHPVYRWKKWDFALVALICSLLDPVLMFIGLETLEPYPTKGNSQNPSFKPPYITYIEKNIRGLLLSEGKRNSCLIERGIRGLTSFLLILTLESGEGWFGLWCVQVQLRFYSIRSMKFEIFPLNRVHSLVQSWEK